MDECHSLGAIGATGRGVEEFLGLPADTIDIKMGTLSKAIPSVGGYVAGSRKLCDYLRHQSRGFIYSGAMPPPAAAAALKALRVIEDEPDRVDRLHANVAHFASALRRAGFDTLRTQSPIFPIVCGENEAAFRAARLMQKRGFYVQGIPAPVVPAGTARLRVSVTAAHRPEDLDAFVEALMSVAAETGVQLQRTAP